MFMSTYVLQSSFIENLIIQIPDATINLYCSWLTFPPVFFMQTESFSKQIGSIYGISSGSRDNSLYNALWAAQALLRKGYAFLPVLLDRII